MFSPMALTVVLALLGALVLSFTFVPAAVALFLGGTAAGAREPPRWLGAARPTRRRCDRRARAGRRRGRRRRRAGRRCARAARHRAGQRVRAEPRRGRHRAAGAPHPGHQPDPGRRDAGGARAAPRARSPRSTIVFAKTGTAEIATDPMPPNVADTFVILKPRAEWPEPAQAEGRARAPAIEERRAALPGQQLRVHPADPDALQRADRRRAQRRRGQGVRRRHRTSCSRPPETIAAVLRTIAGAADVKVEQVTGLPVLTIDDRPARRIARYGLNVADVQDVVEIAVGGKTAGPGLRGRPALRPRGAAARGSCAATSRRSSACPFRCRAKDGVGRAPARSRAFVPARRAWRGFERR